MVPSLRKTCCLAWASGFGASPAAARDVEKLLLSLRLMKRCFVGLGTCLAPADYLITTVFAGEGGSRDAQLSCQREGLLSPLPSCN